MAGFAARLTDSIRARNSVLCAGIDPHMDRIPSLFQQKDKASAVRDWAFELIPLLAGSAPVIKPQAAMFEQLGVRGMQILADLSQAAMAEGLIVIMDAKRGDIGSTAKAYAEGWLGHDAGFPSDALTINPYLGRDSLDPFVAKARQSDSGLFALLRTSNPGSQDVQMIPSADNRPVFHHVVDMIRPLMEALTDSSGFSSFGVVVGATWPEESVALRRMLPECLFLIPGYGAQGGSAADALAGLVKGPEGWEGGLINSSRGLTMPADADEARNLTDWRQAIQRSISDTIAALR
ncbi:orotidine-5'-phosphate decarboxylase [Alphaproteobacteria bacterium]|nr:orotidine-5'-phosphate decarboxylase [Alphaproteobacteria bacterium]